MKEHTENSFFSFLQRTDSPRAPWGAASQLEKKNRRASKWSRRPYFCDVKAVWISMVLYNRHNRYNR